MKKLLFFAVVLLVGCANPQPAVITRVYTVKEVRYNFQQERWEAKNDTITELKFSDGTIKELHGAVIGDVGEEVRAFK